MIRYINDKEKDLVSVDGAVQFAKAVFETILLKNTVPIFLSEHTTRINISLKKLGINKSIFEDEILDLIKENNLISGALKILISEKNSIALLREITYKESDYEKGYSLTISNVIKNSTSLLSYIKSTSYIENLLEREKALINGFNEVIFLNEKKQVAECSMSNIFFVKNQKIYTPSVECGILNGIVRDWIIKNFKVIEGKFFKEEILQADEIFITNSIIGIMKISSVEGITLKEDIITNEITEKYNKLLEEI